MSRVGVFAFCLLAATLAAALPASPKIVNPFQLIRRGPPPPPTDRGPAKAHDTKFFTQKLNHFDILNDSTWQQVFFNSLLFVFLSSTMFISLITEILHFHWNLHAWSTSYFLSGWWVGSECWRSWVHLYWWAGSKTERVHHRLGAQILWTEPPSSVSVLFIFMSKWKVWGHLWLWVICIYTALYTVNK